MNEADRFDALTAAIEGLLAQNRGLRVTRNAAIDAALVLLPLGLHRAFFDLLKTEARQGLAHRIVLGPDVEDGAATCGCRVARETVGGRVQFLIEPCWRQFD